MSLRERLLLRKLRERDESAFRELVSVYGNRVFNLTFRMLGSKEEAEDVAQEVFISVFKSIDSFRGDSKFSTWLYRITANQCKNRIKYLSRRFDRQKTEYDETVSMAATSSFQSSPVSRPDHHLEGVELERMMQQVIATLDEEYRLLIVLRDVEELSYEEICEISGLPEGTVKSRLHRARLVMRKRMKSYMKD